MTPIKHQVRHAIVKNLRIDRLLEDLELEKKLATADQEKMAEKNGGLLPCWKCGRKFLRLDPGNHVCDEGQ